MVQQINSSKKNSSRCAKVSSELKKLVSEYLLNNSVIDEVDSRMISVTDVVVSACLQHAKVYVVSLVENRLSSEDIMLYFERNMTKIRFFVGHGIRLKFIPDFKFFIDDSFEYANKINELFKKISV